MRYFGGKTRICQGLSYYLESIRKPNQIFLSPFIGGGGVEALIKEPKICSDKHSYLMAMYKEIQKGWFPPKYLSEEEYGYIKNNKDEKPYLTGFVGFGCSFAGKWFGGYAKEDGDRNFCLNTYNSTMEKMRGFKNTTFECKDYSQWNPNNMLIYCDPPYFGTTQYDKTIVGQFDHNKFWDIIRKWSKNNIVMVSEYVAPEDFKVMLEIPVKLDILDKSNIKLERTEKLFTHKDTNVIKTNMGLFE